MQIVKIKKNLVLSKRKIYTFIATRIIPELFQR